MCGLFGWKLPPETLDEICLHTLAASLAFNSEARGNESWGVMKHGLTDSNDIELIKMTGSIKQTCRIKDILAPMVIGHTRKATTGAISVSNAHPFDIGNTIGAHNGFIHNHLDLNKEHHRDFEVDSQHLIAHIDQGLSLKTLSGMGTVTYVKKDKPSIIMFGRGSGSDLEIFGIGTPEDCHGIVWASRASWVAEALDMAGCQKYFNFDTQIANQYLSDDFGLSDDTTFDLGFQQTMVTRYQPTNVSAYLGHYDRIEWQGNAYEDPELEQWRERWKEDLLKTRVITTEMAQDFPKAVKKTQKESGVEQGEDSQTPLSTRCCAGCRCYGAAVDDFEDDARGVVWFVQVADYLCYECSAFYSSETVQSVSRVPLVVPELRLWGGGE